MLAWPEQAAFLVPTQEFRHRALGTRFADPGRARANWGDADPGIALANRLSRDTLWDAELRRQAAEHDLPVIEIDGTRSPTTVADDLAHRFHL